MSRKKARKPRVVRSALSGHPLDSRIDQGIRAFVEILNLSGIETYESCQGGEGHCFPEPTIRFHGGSGEGFRALAVAMQHDLPVAALRRIWTMTDGQPTGPNWEMTFYHRADAA